MTDISYKQIVGESTLTDEANPSKALVAVYCGSKKGVNPIYAQAATELGVHLAKAGLGVVYGGATVGLMGQVADGALSENAPVVGVIPEFILKFEVAHTSLTQLHIVKTMHERKAIMADKAKAFITLPGGLGTLEEIMEVATWGQLDQHAKPMIILNINGFYNQLLAHLAHVVAEGFMQAEDRARLIVCHTVSEAVEMLVGIAR